MPDIFVPADTTQDTYLVQEMDDNLLFTAYVIDRLQPQISDFKSAHDFIDHFTISDAMFDDFILYASTTLKEMDSNEIMISKQPIKTLIKAYAARFKWGDESYYQTVNNEDAGFKKAIAAIN